MTMTTVTLDQVAEAVDVHPRTILRYVMNDRNTYWAEDHNPEFPLERVAKALGCRADIMKHVLRGSDEFMKPDDAAEELGLPPRTFRHRGYTPAFRAGRVVRYSRSKLINEHFAKWD